MKLLEDTKAAWTRWKFNKGFMTRDEVVKTLLPDREDFLKQLPAQGRAEVSELVYSMDDIKVASDVPEFTRRCAAVSLKLLEIATKYGPEDLGTEIRDKIGYISGVDSAGYRPSAARAWRFFINPFSVFSYMAEHHWAVKAAVDVILTEVCHDDFHLEHDPRMNPAIVQAREEFIRNDLNISQMRLDLLKHYLVYGNALVLPHRNLYPRNIVKLEQLVMDRIMPVWDEDQMEVAGWEYWYGRHSTYYPKESLLHVCNPSLKYPSLGIPPLSSAVIDCESDLFASALNRTVMDKAGMVAVIISTEDSGTSNNKFASATDKASKKLQKEIQAQFSGIRGGSGILVSNYVKQVHKISQIGEFDGAFLKLRQEVGKAVAICLRVPPEKISINRSSSLQYQAALVEDTINAAFDRAIYAYMKIIDGFINDKILKGLFDIDDVKVEANGRFGSLTLNGARAGLIASQTSDAFENNELRTIFYGCAPLPAWDRRGRKLVDNSQNRNVEAIPAEYAPQDEAEAKKFEREQDKRRDEREEAKRQEAKKDKEKPAKKEKDS